MDLDRTPGSEAAQLQIKQLVSFDTYSQIANEVDCIEVEKVQVKGISEELRAFQVVLDTGEKPNTLNIETENLHCSLNIDRLAIDEVNKLEQFIEDAKRKIESTDKSQKLESHLGWSGLVRRVFVFWAFSLNTPSRYVG